MSRDAIEATLRALYAARQAGDCDGILRHMTPDASYAMMGDPGASPVAGRHQGDALCQAMTTLVTLFPARHMHLASIVIDGDRAAIEVEARLAFGPTGEEFDTRWASLFTFRDGKIAEVREFIDTARATQLLATMQPNIATPRQGG
jgi:ketosteroid isomerase-like protein